MIFRWIGNGAGVKSDYNDGRNWCNEVGTAYAQARYPGSVAGVYDDVIIDNDLVTGALSPSTNVNQSAAAAKLRSFRISAAYTGSVGSTGSDPSGKLKIEADSVMIDGTGAGDIYLFGSGTNGLNNLVVTGGNKIHLDGKITNPTFSKGVIDIAATGNIVTGLTVNYLSNASTDVNLTIPALSNALPSIVNVLGGVVYNSNSITTLNVSAGIFSQLLGDITTFNISGSGVVIWSAGNIATLNGVSGSLTGAGSGVFRRIDTANVGAKFSLNIDNKLNNILISNYCEIDAGGVVTFANGAKLQQYKDVSIAGASDARQGLSPQVVNNTTVNGDAIYLGYNDRLDILCCAGSIATGGALAFKLYQDSTSAFTTEAEITAQAKTFTDADDDKTKLMTIWGYQLTTGNNYVRVKATVTGAYNAYVCAPYRKSSS